MDARLAFWAWPCCLFWFGNLDLVALFVWHVTNLQGQKVRALLLGREEDVVPLEVVLALVVEDHVDALLDHSVRDNKIKKKGQEDIAKTTNDAKQMQNHDIADACCCYNGPARLVQVGARDATFSLLTVNVLYFAGFVHAFACSLLDDFPNAPL